MTTTYTFDQLKEDVRKEAEALKVHATNEERGKLDWDELDPKSITNCIYGQMTGDCNSARGATLIEKCACRYIKDSCLTDVEFDGFERIQKKVNGETVKDFVNNRMHGAFVTHYSAIEAYILLPEARNENLIAYLRGETYNLEL